MSLLSLKPPQERSTSKGKRIVPIVVKTSASEDRPRRGRISITAGEESEANVTCGFSQLSRQDVLEEGEHKRTVNIPHMFALFEDDLTLIMGAAGFAAFGCSTSGYGYSPSSCSGKRQSRARGRSLASRHRKEKRIVPIVSIVVKTSASKDQASPNDRFGVKHFL